jgi:hypothetical protein
LHAYIVDWIKFGYSSILPPSEIDKFGIFVEGMGKSFQRHVEGSVPSHNLWSWTVYHISQFSELSLRTFAHVGRLVELPDFSFRDLVVGVGDDGARHIAIGSIVPDVLVGELIFLNLGAWREDVEGALALVVNTEGEEHEHRSSVEVADGQLNDNFHTSLKRR